MKRRGRGERASAHNQDIGLENVKHPGRSTFIRGVERQNLGATNLLSQLSKGSLLSRRRENTRAIARSSLDDSPPYPSAAADHDHGLACQCGHLALFRLVGCARCADV
jgi:hypothetical protein